jgi:hypothetical protein
MHTVKLSIEDIEALIEFCHPNCLKENRSVFILKDKITYECDTFFFKEKDVLKLEELLLKTYPPEKYNLHLYKIEQDYKLDIDYLIEQGYITKDNWCPIRFIPVEDRKSNPTFRIRAKFLPKQ